MAIGYPKKTSKFLHIWMDFSRRAWCILKTYLNSFKVYTVWIPMEWSKHFLLLLYISIHSLQEGSWSDIPVFHANSIYFFSSSYRYKQTLQPFQKNCFARFKWTTVYPHLFLTHHQLIIELLIKNELNFTSTLVEMPRNHSEKWISTKW